MQFSQWAGDTFIVSSSLAMTCIAFDLFVNGFTKLTKILAFHSLIKNLPQIVAAFKKEDDGSIKFNIGNT